MFLLHRLFIAMMFSFVSVDSSLGIKNISKMIYQLKFVLLWIFLIPQLTDGGRITWHRPAPVQITSNPGEVLPPGIVPAYVGEPATLKWNYSLTEKLLVAVVKFDGDTIVSVGSTGMAGAITSNFQGRFSVSSDIRSVTLSILKVTVADDKDNGNFSCEVSTFASETWIRNIQVQVRAPVKITDQVTGDQVVPEGGDLHLFCKVTGRPTPNVNWTKVPTDGSNEIKHYGPTWNFTNINVTNSGIYSCVADNKVEDPVRGQAVKVIVFAPVSIADTENKFIVTVGEIVTLNCKAKGNPPLSYTWTPCSEVQVCDMETLDTPPVNKDVNFTCKAADEFTNDSKSYIVFIGGTVINITLVITSESCPEGEYDRSTLFEKLNKTFNDVLADKFGLLKMKLNNVGCGSLKVDLALNFNSTTKEIDVLTELRKAVKDGKLGEFTVSSIDGTRDDEGTTSKVPTTPKSSSNTAAIVGGSVGGALLCCAAGGAAYYKKKQNENKKKGKNPRVDTNGGQGRRDGDQEAGYDNNYAEVGPGANCPRKGGNVRNEQGIPDYAVVDKTKRKKKTPKPGELQYAELGELTVPGRKATMPRVSATDTVYADVRS